MSKQREAYAQLVPGGFLAKFMPRGQLTACRFGVTSEEGESIAENLLKVKAGIEAAPKTYDQDGKGMDAIVHAHYFRGAMNFYITEFDRDDYVGQAFGWADLGDPECAELGYISIAELVANHVELDLYWTPKTLKECVK